MTRICLIPLIAVLLAAPSVLAQNSTIQGVVTDQSGGMVPQAAIRATNVETGVKLETFSNDRGLYTVPFLPGGTYRIEASNPGFAPSSVDRVKLDVQQTARVDFTLSIGGLAQVVEVSAAGALLESESTQMGQVIENKRIVEMPLNKRNYLELARLTPGVLPAQSPGVGSAVGGDGGIVAMGQRAHQTNVLLDGVDNSSRTAGGELGGQAQGAAPSVDAVGEFRVLTNNFSAEFGYRTGPKVIVSLKSGTNRLHGTAFEFLRNHQLDASNFFANRSGSAKPTYKQNQFGGTAGGRIVRDRTFWFASYEGTRTRLGRSLLSTVPSTLSRTGNFSGEAVNRNRIFDPDTTTGAAAVARRLPFANNTIPRSRMDAVVQNVFGLYPLPNVAGRDFSANNYFRSPADTADGNQYDVKIDHNFSQRDRMFARYSGRRRESVRNSPLPVEAGASGGWPVVVNGDNYAGAWVHTLSASAYNELRFGYTKLVANRADLLEEPLNQKYGIKNAPGDTFDDGVRSGFSLFNPAGFATLGSGGTPLENTLDNRHILDNVAIQKGAHALKMGFEHRQFEQFTRAHRFRRGQFTFSGVFTSEMPNVAASRTTTGNVIADMLLGSAATTVVGTTTGEAAVVPYWGTYFQDDWKVSSRLTVNVGLRWELYQSTMYNGGWKKGFGGVSTYLTQYNGVFPGDPRYETFLKPKDNRDCGCEQDLNNFAPRLGMAYRLTPRTVVRASGGIFFGEGDGAYVSQSSFSNQTPDFSEPTTTGTNTEPAAKVANGFPIVQLPASAPVPGSGVSSRPRKRVNFYASQWFFDVQRELPGGLLWVVGYQGTKSVKLAVAPDVNNGGPHPSIPAAQRRVRPQWTAVNVHGWPAGSGSYQGLVTRLEKRYSMGLSLLAAYTWSHNIDNSTEFNDANAAMADPYNLRRERGNSNLDNRHNFTSSLIYELPFGRGRSYGASLHGVADALLGGWQLGGLITLRTGFPFDVRYPGDPQNTGTLSRGDRVGVGTVSDPTIDRWYDQFAFVQSAPGVFGNNARNVLFGPGTKNLDIMAGKSFRMPWEGHRLQFRFESFNFTNTARFGQPNVNLRDPATATISSAEEPRRIQFGMKYIF